MRHFRRLLCAHGGGCVSESALSPLPVHAPRSATTKLYHRCLDPLTPPSDVARCTADLLPAIGGGELAVSQQVRLLQALSARAIRNEDVMLKCLWGVFKAPLPSCAALAELSAYTSSAFQVMAEQQLLNDPQLTAVALGRCVELAPHSSLDGLRRVYRGLRNVNHTFFTLADVAHHTSEVTEQMTTKDFYEMADSPDAETLRHQPNLMDVLCGELEQQLWRLSEPEALARVLEWQHTGLLPSVSVDVPPDAASTITLDAPAAASWLLDVLEALSVVGVMHASTFDALTALAQRCSGASSPGFFIAALAHATTIEERVVDPLTFEESAAVRDSRRALTLCLSGALQRVRGLHGYLRRHPPELLLLRRLFERHSGDDAILSLALWDAVRAVRVAHHLTVPASTRRPKPTGGLFDKRYRVKVAPVTVSDAEAERFVPPQFKTWSNPAATPRGGHNKNRRPPRRVAFGTRRISKDYIKGKRKKYCPATL